MWNHLQRLRQAFATSPNRIAFVWALRGTIATATPLVALPALGVGPLANFVVMGAMNTSMVDVGGSYRSRLAAMSLNALLSPIALLLGSYCRGNSWLAPLLMFLIAFGSGFVRAVGPAGVSLGLTVGLTFLVGIGVHDRGGSGLEWAALYCVGGLWTILVALVFWRLRPYRRLEQELAGVWEATTALVVAARMPVPAVASVVQRRRKERLIAKRHQLLRDAVEAALRSLGVVRGDVAGAGTIMAQFLILLRAASRIGAAAVTLSELPLPRQAGGLDDIRAKRLAAGEELQKICRSIAGLLLAGKSGIDLSAMEARLADLSLAMGENAGEVLAFAQAVRHLESAAEAMEALFLTGGRAYPGLRLGIARPWRIADIASDLSAHLTFRSAIFRHALRVALAAAVATAVMAHVSFAHGIWVPIATMIVLQPEFGGTFDRALQRTAGTVAGAALAGLLLATLPGSVLFEPIIILLLFGAFFMLRRRYGLGVACMTPLVVLILATTDTNPWWDTLERIVDTVLGAALGLAAGYSLWPQWERERLPGVVARALRANRSYMAGVLQGLAEGGEPDDLGLLRRTTEIETGNAEAAFQRLLAEPRRHRGRMAQAFAMVTYLQRLERHLIALAEQIGTISPGRDDLKRFSTLLGEALGGIAATVESDGRLDPCPYFDAVLERLRADLIAHEAGEHGPEVAFLLSRVASDTRSLHAAAMHELSEPDMARVSVDGPLRPSAPVGER
jgi:uncharacterized membrane protein YccC